MSAMLDDADAEALVCDSLDECAPLFKEALEAALAECNDNGLDAYAYETVRSEELQALYYARGRTQIPPEYTVTNAPSAMYGWHFYGLAADVISKSKRWSVSRDWRKKVNAIMRKHGLDCGSDWPHPDEPHVQWGKCKKSPGLLSRTLYREGAKQSRELGLRAVWEATGAI